MEIAIELLDTGSHGLSTTLETSSLEGVVAGQTVALDVSRGRPEEVSRVSTGRIKRKYHSRTASSSIPRTALERYQVIFKNHSRTATSKVPRTLRTNTSVEVLISSTTRRPTRRYKSQEVTLEVTTEARACMIQSTSQAEPRYMIQSKGLSGTPKTVIELLSKVDQACGRCSSISHSSNS